MNEMAVIVEDPETGLISIWGEAPKPEMDKGNVLVPDGPGEGKFIRVDEKGHPV